MKKKLPYILFYSGPIVYYWVQSNSRHTKMRSNEFQIYLLSCTGYFWWDRCVISLIKPKCDYWLSLDLRILYVKLLCNNQTFKYNFWKTACVLWSSNGVLPAIFKLVSSLLMLIVVIIFFLLPNRSGKYGQRRKNKEIHLKIFDLATHSHATHLRI